MKSDRYFLSLDQGGHSSRALIFDSCGNVVSRAQCAVDVSVQGDRVEQSPGAIVASLRQAATEAVAGLPVEKLINLQSAALVCQRSSIAFWRADDAQPVAPVISWQDRRGANLLSEITGSRISRDALRDISGLVVNPHYGASKLAWMLRNNADVQAAQLNDSLRCGPLSAFLVRALSRNTTDVVDAANACRTQLVNLATMDWDNSALAAFSLAREQLPRIMPTFGDYGMLALKDISLPLKYVNGDQNAALFANGTVDPQAIYVSIGTGAFCLAPWNSADVPPRQLLVTLIALLQSPLYAIEGTVNAAASAIDWLQNELKVEYPHTVITQWLGKKSLDEQETQAIFINAINGLASPFWRNDVESRFIADDIATLTHAERFVAVIESIVFALCFNMQLMKKSGIAARRVYVAGGLGQYDGICQRIADITCLPVIRHEDAEASARGAAFWLAGCPAKWAAQLSRSQFAPQTNTHLQARYERWCNVMKQYVS